MLASVARGLMAFANWCLSLSARALSRSGSDPARSILIHRVGRLGDGAAAWPAVASLRAQHPEAHLVLWTSVGETPSPGLADFARDLVDEVRTYRPTELRSPGALRAQAAAFKGERFDLWQALPQVGTSPATELRNLLFARASGARRLRGFQVGNVRWFGRWLERRFQSTANESQRLLQLVGGGVQTYHYQPSSEAQARARQLLNGSPFLALAPGSARPANRWPLERFQAVAQAELERGGQVVVVGGPAERALGEELLESLVHSDSGGRARNLAGDCSAEDTIAVLARARALVTNDSGAAHLGGLAELPIVMIQGARDVPGRWTPRGSLVTVLRENPTCSPCWADTCPLDHRCLLDISTDRVLSALGQLSALAHTSALAQGSATAQLGTES